MAASLLCTAIRNKSSDINYQKRSQIPHQESALHAKKNLIYMNSERSGKIIMSLG